MWFHGLRLGLCCLTLSLSLPALDIEDLGVRKEKIPEQGPLVVEQRERDPTMVVDDQERYVYIDINGQVVAGPYADAYPFSDGLALVCREDGSYQFIGRDGTVALAGVEGMDIRGSFADGYAVAVTGSQWWYIDVTGEKKLGPYTRAWPFKDGFAMVDTGNQLGLIATNGKMIYNNKPWQTIPNGQVIAIQSSRDGYWQFLDVDGRRFLRDLYQDTTGFAEGWAAVQIDEDGWAYVNPEGEIMPKRKRYARALPFTGNWGAVQDDDGKWALFDRQKERKVGTFAFHHLRPFHDDRAAVWDPEQELWGYIDTEGDWVIKAQFEEAFNFTNGLALVGSGVDEWYINTAGGKVWPR